MDLLADLLSRAGVRGSAGARISAGQRWGLSWGGTPGAGFYAVTEGSAWLGTPDEPLRRLSAGDLVLLPSGTEHTLRDAPGTAIDHRDCTAAVRAQEAGEALRLGHGAERTRILGASFSSDSESSTRLFAALPGAVVVHADRGGELDGTIRLLSRELAHPGLATTVVLDRLVDVLLVQLLRTWLDERPGEAAGSPLGILCDPVVRAALTALHQDPARPWTTSSLAASAAVSRATLTRRFLHATGEAPGAYLTRWRMDLAAARLRGGSEPLAAVARAVGYTSVPAFSRAFARIRGRSPGRYRLDARAARP